MSDKKLLKLPKIDYPTYSVKLPSTGQTIKYRPINVREEKILLMAMEGEEVNAEEIMDATKQVIQNCVISPANFDAEETASFDIEYLLLQIRIKSIGEKIKIYFHGFDERVDECPTCAEEKEVEIDLTKVKVSGIENFNNKIFFSNEKSGLIMKPQTWKRINQIYAYEFEENKDESDRLLELVATSIDAIFDEKNVYNASDYKIDELISYVEDLPKPDFVKVQNYFKAIPRLQHEVDITCPACKHSVKHTFKGLDSFFG